MGAPAGARRNARPDEIVYSESELFQRRLRRLAGANISDGNRIRLLTDGTSLSRNAAPHPRGALQRRDGAISVLAGCGRARVHGRPGRGGATRGRGARHHRPVWLLAAEGAPCAADDRRGRAAAPVQPARIAPPLVGLLPRDHRKLLVADGAVAVTGGIDIADVSSDRARPRKQRWRDNAVRIDGRAVRDLVETFEAMWARSGRRSWRKWDIIDDLTPHGVVNGEDAIVGVVKGVPGHWTIERSSQVLAVTARERIWIWDAYFVPSPPETDALIMAARDGVDARLLVPSRSDPAWVRPLTRRFFRELTQGGVRVFEWQSDMMHAKTTVTDGRWVRVGSTDFNPLGVAINFELDAVILDEALGAELEEAFLQD